MGFLTEDFIEDAYTHTHTHTHTHISCLYTGACVCTFTNMNYTLSSTYNEIRS